MWVIEITQEVLGGPKVSTSLTYKYFQFRNVRHGAMNGFRAIITAFPIRRLAQPSRLRVIRDDHRESEIRVPPRVLGGVG